MILSHLLVFMSCRARGTARCTLALQSYHNTYLSSIAMYSRYSKCSQAMEQIWNMCSLYHSQKMFVLLELMDHRWCWNLISCSSFRWWLENEPKKSICRTHWLVWNCKTSFIVNGQLQNAVQHIQNKGRHNCDTWNSTCYLQTKVNQEGIVSLQKRWKKPPYTDEPISVCALNSNFTIFNLSFFCVCVLHLMTWWCWSTNDQFANNARKWMTLCCPHQCRNGFYTYLAKLIAKPHLIVLECIRRPVFPVK